MNSIYGSLAALALIVLIYGPWQHTCTDWARQVMFRHRDRLFDLAMNGMLSFEGQPYKVLRRRIEMNIRFAHELTLPRLLLMIAHRKITGGNIPSKPNNTVLEQIADQNVRGQVADILKKSQMALVYMIILKSPLAFITLPFVIYPVIIYRINVKLYQAAVSLLAKIIGIIQVEAEGSDFNNNFGG